MAYAPVIAPSIYSNAYNSVYSPPSTSNPFANVNPQQQQQQPQSNGINLPSFGLGNNTGPFSGITSGIQQGIDTFGANAGFGAGSSVVGPLGPIQPVANAGSLTSASLSGTLGAAGLGALGGGLLAKFTGGNPTGGSIGGAIGAGIGNIVLPGAGGLIGGFLGGIGGSLFGGGKPSNKLQVGFVNLGTGQVDPEGRDKQSQTGKKFSAENGAFRDSISDAAAKASQFLIANGAKATGAPKLMLGVGSRDGYWYSYEDYNGANDFQSRQTNTKDPNALASGVIDSLTKLQNASPELAAQAKQIYYNALKGGGTNSTGATNLQAQNNPPPVPMIAGKKPDNNTFENFFNKYKTQNNAA